MTSAIVARVARQVGGIVLADNAQWMNRVEIRSESSSRLYVVAQNKQTKDWGCSCPGWAIKRHGRERTCKHLQKMMPLLSQRTARPALKD
jgi:hypothetical protein